MKDLPLRDRVNDLHMEFFILISQKMHEDHELKTTSASQDGNVPCFLSDRTFPEN